MFTAKCSIETREDIGHALEDELEIAERPLVPSRGQVLSTASLGVFSLLDPGIKRRGRFDGAMLPAIRRCSVFHFGRIKSKSDMYVLCLQKSELRKKPS